MLVSVAITPPQQIESPYSLQFSLTLHGNPNATDESGMPVSVLLVVVLVFPPVVGAFERAV